MFPTFSNMATVPLTSLCLRNVVGEQRAPRHLGKDFATSLSALRLDCITRLSIEIPLKVSAATFILTLFPSVEHLILGLSIDESETDYSAEPREILVDLPLLLSLEITGYSNVEHNRMHIIAPHLKQITYPHSRAEEMHLAHPNRFQYPNLKRFSAYLYEGIEDDWLGEFLDGNPQLEDLYVPCNEDEQWNEGQVYTIREIFDTLRETRHEDVVPRAQRLRRVLLDVNSGVVANLESEEDELSSSLRSLLRECPDLELSIACWESRKLRENGFDYLGQLVDEFGPRVTVVHDQKNVTGWPNAWDRWTERG